MGFTLMWEHIGRTVFLQDFLVFLAMRTAAASLSAFVRRDSSRKGRTEGFIAAICCVMIHTACFVVGVSFAFFLLGLGVSAVGKLGYNQTMFARAGGIFGDAVWLNSWGYLEHLRCLKNTGCLSGWIVRAMSPFTALIAGFYLQLCMDALCRACFNQCPSDGSLRRHWLVQALG